MRGDAGGRCVSTWLQVTAQPPLSYKRENPSAWVAVYTSLWSPREGRGCTLVPGLLMAKRKCEPPLLALLPPCKRPLCELPVYSRRCAPHILQVSQRRKRKQEAIPEGEKLPHREGATAAPQPPSKKMKLAESQDSSTASDFQCQKDEEFREYNSFHFWKPSLPDIDFSELVDGTCDDDRRAACTGTDVLEEMDN